jgi:acetyl/propionyl-CoA carboxylase alpha subunit
MNTRISTNAQHAIAGSNGNGASLLKFRERNERDHRVIQEQPQQPSAVPNGGRGTRTKLLAAAIAGALVIIAAFSYSLHARNFQSTDDAYTTTHVHDISARVAGYVQSVNVDDNQFVKAGQTLVVLDQRDFKVALHQAKGFDPVTALKQAYAVIKSVVQRDAFVMAFNDAFLVLTIGLLVSAIAIWIVKVPKSPSAQVPAH